ncbi:uncharacterized protein NESG_01932 [Nematocida ausubeli]|uniref:Uncharacterized protein n=1 Tax=Nematocida ausubeli (strain ATCC PRA-371 / ERTm2) TaxID=1913371 RepID=A0A086J1C5_NEMA1|nr:uncharacterized protein NESG_01932 [Nematocida ausubeli]KFG25943.1 hypothetical protein NESG_01932 [Nematocida ausubeli]
MELYIRSNYKKFLSILSLAKGLDYGQNKLSKLIMKSNRGVALTALFQAQEFNELYRDTMAIPKTGSGLYRCALGAIAASIYNKELRQAHRLAEHFISADAPTTCQILLLVIEGHIYLTNKQNLNMLKCKAWSKRVLEELKDQFSYGLFILAYKVHMEVLLDTEDETLFKLFSVVKCADPEYFSVLEDIKDIRKLENFLRLKNLPHENMKKIYILKNPLTNKTDLLDYFQENPTDKETLQYVMERRVFPELVKLATDLGIMEGDVKDKQIPRPWIYPFHRLPGDTDETASGNKSNNYLKKLVKNKRKLIVEGVHPGPVKSVKVPRSFNVSHDNSEDGMDEYFGDIEVHAPRDTPARKVHMPQEEYLDQADEEVKDKPEMSEDESGEEEGGEGEDANMQITPEDAKRLLKEFINTDSDIDTDEEEIEGEEIESEDGEKEKEKTIQEHGIDEETEEEGESEESEIKAEEAEEESTEDIKEKEIELDAAQEEQTDLDAVETEMEDLQESVSNNEETEEAEEESENEDLQQAEPEVDEETNNLADFDSSLNHLSSDSLSL